MTSTTTRGLLYSSLHRFNNALENLESFQKEKDIIENIGYLDNFFSNFRSTTFVLQQSLAHTSYMSSYETLREKYLNNPLGNWFRDTRNEIEKRSPFELNKKILVSVYHKHNAEIFESKIFNIENDIPYSEFIDLLKQFLRTFNPVEVHCSLEYIFTQEGKDHDLYHDLIEGISNMKCLLMELYKIINDKSDICDSLIKKIEESMFYTAPKEYLFISDYVYYPQKDLFETGERYQILLPEEKTIDIATMFKNLGFRETIYDSKEFLKALIKVHIVLYLQQNNKIMPTFFIVDSHDKCTIESFDSTIRTTAYRKINDLAQRVRAGGIKHITLIHECYVYENFKHHNKPYVERIQYSTQEALAFYQIGKYIKYRVYTFDVKKLKDRQYIKETLKKRPEDNVVIENSLFYPLFLAFRDIRKHEKMK